MKKRITFALILISLLSGGCQHEEAEPSPQEDITIPERREPLEELHYMPGEVLVRFKEEVTDEEKTALIDKWRFDLIEKVALADIYRLRVPTGMTVSEAVEKLERIEEVKHAQPNYIFKIGI